MPNSRPMPAVAAGVSEIRVKGEDGIFRVFYYTASPLGVQEFQPNVRVARDTSGATKNRTHGPPPNALSGKSIGPQEGIC